MKFTQRPMFHGYPYGQKALDAFEVIPPWICFDFGGDDTPSPTAAEQAQTAVLEEQRALLQEQSRQQALLAPFLFEESGVEPVLNEMNPETGKLQDPSLPEGAIIAFNPIEDPLDPLREDIERATLERTQAALEGNLPVSPALERDIEVGETELRSSLLKQLGTGFETSTPGIEALDKFFRSSEEIREAARTGDLTLASQLSLQREQQGQSNIDDLIRQISGVSNIGASSIQQGLGVAQGFGAAAAPTQQANLASQTARTSTLGSLFGALGTAGGITAGLTL